MIAKVTDKHQEIANEVLWGDVDNSMCPSLDTIAQAIADAEARGREAGIREALKCVVIDGNPSLAREKILALLTICPARTI